jgi:hypothetical protein
MYGEHTHSIFIAQADLAFKLTIRYDSHRSYLFAISGRNLPWGLSHRSNPYPGSSYAPWRAIYSDALAYATFTLEGGVLLPLTESFEITHSF